MDYILPNSNITRDGVDYTIVQSNYGFVVGSVLTFKPAAQNLHALMRHLAGVDDSTGRVDRVTVSSLTADGVGVAYAASPLAYDVQSIWGFIRVAPGWIIRHTLPKPKECENDLCWGGDTLWGVDTIVNEKRPPINLPDGIISLMPLELALKTLDAPDDFSGDVMSLINSAGDPALKLAHYCATPGKAEMGIQLDQFAHKLIAINLPDGASIYFKCD